MTLLRDLKKPFNLVTFILTVFSILLSVFFYYKAEKQKSISFSVSEQPSLIFDSQNSVPTIKIYEKDSVPIKQNIYLLTGTIWNDGDFPVMKSDVRLPLIISLDEKNRILDFKIIKQSDKAIANFDLQKQSFNSLKINWDYFDPNFGFKFQIIYVGNNVPGFNLNGKILDISDFNKIEKQEEITPVFKYMTLFSFILMLIYGIHSYLRDRHFRSKTIRNLNIIQVLIPLGFLIFFVFYFYNSKLPPI